MNELSSSPRSLENSASSKPNYQRINKQRVECLICKYRIDPHNKSAFVEFPCNVRAFKDETFKVWQCPSCQTIHCLDIVDLNHYYSQYPFAEASLNWRLRCCYQNLCQQLGKHGFSKTHSLLDYGCAKGLFIHYLRERGFNRCYGYDPYASQDSFGDPTALQQGPFDYILLQDVIEHVEDPYALLEELDGFLAPNGYILIGTPNASNINLNQPNLSDYYNPVHVPYHLHIYTRESLEWLGSCQGWKPVDFFDRPYHDTLWFGLNSRAWNEYQRLFDGTLNAIFEPLKFQKLLISYKFLFYAMFGYWLSFHTEMAIMFHKPKVDTLESHA